MHNEKKKKKPEGSHNNHRGDEHTHTKKKQEWNSCLSIAVVAARRRGLGGTATTSPAASACPKPSTAVARAVKTTATPAVRAQSATKLVALATRSLVAAPVPGSRTREPRAANAAAGAFRVHTSAALQRAIVVFKVKVAAAAVKTMEVAPPRAEAASRMELRSLSGKHASAALASPTQPR